MKNYYSAHCALGWDGPHQTLRARILRALDPRLRVHDDLEAFFAPALSQQKEAALKRWSNDDDDGDIFLANERQHFAPDTGFEGRKGCLHIESVVPAMEGGVDYREQFELMQLANVALLEQIKQLQSHTGVMKDVIEVCHLFNLYCIED